MPVIIGGVDSTGSILMEGARFETSVNGVPGACSFRYRDDTANATFVVGQPIVLKINNVVLWRGFITRVTSTYIFPAYDTTTFLTRFFDIEGADLNILFTRRVTFKQSSPAAPFGPTFAAGTSDLVVIQALIAGYLDLSGDGIDTTAYVDAVGSPDPALKFRAWDAGWTWGDAMSNIAKIPGAIYYIDPDANLVYCDPDVPNAPFGLSDQPDNVTTTSYSDMEVLKDGSSLANDVLAWGFGYGSQTPVFKRAQSTASQTTHGLWQTGEISNGVYKQGTIDRIATSILDGSPQNHRGHKDDRYSVMVTTRQPGFRAAQKVPFTSNVFGYSDTLPIRKMEITFAGPNNPVYRLTLSFDIDPAWTMFDPFQFSGFHLPGIQLPPPVVPPPPGGCVCGITDSFNRTVADGWGQSDSSLPWVTSGIGPISVDGARGVLRASDPGAYYYAEANLPMPGPYPAGMDVTVELQANHALDSGTPGSGLAAMEYIYIYAGGSTYVELGRDSGSSDQSYVYLTTFVTSDTAHPTVDFTLPFMVNIFQATAISAIEARVWQSSGSKPVAATASVGPDAQVLNGLTIGAAQQALPSAPAVLVVTAENLDIVDVNICTNYRFDSFDDRTIAPDASWGLASSHLGHWVERGPGTSTQSVASGWAKIEQLDDGTVNQHGSVYSTTSDNLIAPIPPPWAGDFTLSTAFSIVELVDSANLPSDLGSWGIGLSEDITSGSFDQGILLTSQPPSAYPRDLLTFIPATGSPVEILTTLSAGSSYSLKWKKAGDLHAVKLWSYGTAEPIGWNITATSSSIVPGGFFAYQQQPLTRPAFPAPAGPTNLKIWWYEFDFQYPEKPCFEGGPPSGAGGAGVGGTGAGVATTTDNQTYQLVTSYFPGSTVVSVNGLVKIRGTDYTESSPIAGQIMFTAPLAGTPSVSVTYISTGSL